MKKQEIWETIQNTNNLYQVSNLGNVRSWRKLKGGRRKLKKMKFTQDHNGYYKLSLRVFDKYGYKKMQTFNVHKLVAYYFLDQPKLGENEIDHINGDRHDNRVENLRWTTRKENMANSHKYKDYQFIVEHKDTIGGYAIRGRFRTQEGAREFCNKVGIQYMP